ncbi:MAG: hypothetical protein ABEK01_00800 [Candidatus Nanohaloarchaea archaeon]
MELKSILLGSLELLRDRPSLFIPKLVSTSASTAWILGFLLGYLDRSVYLLSFPFLVLVGVVVSVMVARMVEHREEDRVLWKSFRDTMADWTSLAGLTVFFLVSSILIALPASFGVVMFRLSGEVIYPVAGLLATLTLTLVLSFVVYFVPVSVVKNSSLLTSFRDSVRTSTSHSREVTILILLSALLIGPVALTQGALQRTYAAAFVLVRYLSAVVTTYIFVVSPTFYNAAREKE